MYMKTLGRNFVIHAIQDGRKNATCFEARAGGGGAHFTWWSGAAAGGAPAEAIPNPGFYFTRRCQVRGPNGWSGGVLLEVDFVM